MHASEKLPTGTEVLDELLEGGYDMDAITTVYGPAGSGKTTTCLLAALSAATGKNKKVIFLDTEGGFSTERLRQLTGSDAEARKVMERILLIKIASFAEQRKAIETLSQQISQNVFLIVCDTISSLYRIERGEDNTSLNRELGKQVSRLLALARMRNIPVILTTPVYADFNNKDKVNMVGGDILKYSSKSLLELVAGGSSTRLARLVKHRSLPERQTGFRITEKGFEKT